MFGPLELGRHYERALEENQDLEGKVAELQETLESVSYMLAEVLRARGVEGGNDLKLCQQITHEMGEDDVVELILGFQPALAA